jgi:diacylglycerol kinase (ATP)
LRNFFIIINPVSGPRDSEKKFILLKKRLEREHIPFKEFRTRPDLLADQIVRDFFKPEFFSDILIIGGDGTINEVFNGLGKLKIPVSIISAGTGNDTARAFLGNLDFRRQLEIVIKGECSEIDAGECNGKIFLNGLGIGFDGRVVEKMSLNYKNYKGKFSYYRTVISLLSGYRESVLKVTLDNETVREEVFLMTVSKGSTFGGGFRLNPYALNTDGMLDICVVRKIPVLKRFVFLPTMSFAGHKNLKQVSFYKSKECIIDANDQHVAHLDGEFIGHPPFAIKVLPKFILIRNLLQ